MRQGPRLAAAIDILGQIFMDNQPVALALSDWGKKNRYAGSGDRDVIGRIVYDALRVKASAAHILGDDSPRSIALGTMSRTGSSVEEIAALCDGSEHAPAPLSDAERQRLSSPDLSDAAPWVVGDYPEWLHGSFERVFADRLAVEMQAFTHRAPADLRVNTLKATPEKALKALSDFAAEPTALAPNGLRIPPPPGSKRMPNLQAEASFQAGWCEIQDQGSQIAAALSGAAPGKQVLDLCAGGGGKTLALAAMMDNKGQLYAYDVDRNRLKPIYERIKRAGVRNVQVLRGGDSAALEALGDRFDVVFVDAPCTGTGTWRRRPDAKWRMRPMALERRQQDQVDVLESAVRHVKPGGRLVYVTCSNLPEENTDQVAAFVERHPEFRIIPFADVWRQTVSDTPVTSADGRTDTLVLTPASHETDGFFVAILERATAAS